MTTDATAAQRVTHIARSDPLRVELAFDPGDSMVCPVSDIDGTVDEVTINAIDGTCNSDVRVTNSTGETSIVRSTVPITPNCLCYVFQLDCVPDIRSVDGGLMTIKTYVTDRETLPGLIDGLGEIGDSVELVRLTAPGGKGEELVTVDLSTLTARQREALELAVSNGYYDSEREVTLSEMAEELGISKSALSQRLRVAQSKLVTELVLSFCGSDVQRAGIRSG